METRLPELCVLIKNFHYPSRWHHQHKLLIKVSHQNLFFPCRIRLVVIIAYTVILWTFALIVFSPYLIIGSVLVYLVLSWLIICLLHYLLVTYISVNLLKILFLFVLPLSKTSAFFKSNVSSSVVMSRDNLWRLVTKTKMKRVVVLSTVMFFEVKDYSSSNG